MYTHLHIHLLYVYICIYIYVSHKELHHPLIRDDCIFSGLQEKCAAPKQNQEFGQIHSILPSAGSHDLGLTEFKRLTVEDPTYSYKIDFLVLCLI